MDLLRQFDPTTYQRALRAWRWLPGLAHTRGPLVASPFGDVFLDGPDGIWRLDVLDGTLTRPWATVVEMRSHLATEGGQDEHLHGGFALAADRAGTTLRDGEVYGFVIHPLVGGSFDLSNVVPTDFVAWLTVCGQLHEHAQLPGLEPA